MFAMEWLKLGRSGIIQDDVAACVFHWVFIKWIGSMWMFNACVLSSPQKIVKDNALCSMERADMVGSWERDKNTAL